MKNLAVILAPLAIPEWDVPFISDQSPQKALESYVQSLPDLGNIFIYGQNLGIPGTQVNPDNLTREVFFNWLHQVSSGYDYVFLFWADCPFLDKELTQTMWTNVRDWRAEYLFADGYPYGLAPEIIKTPILSFVKELSLKYPGNLERSMLFDTMAKDIVAFDIETQISPVDLRHLRLSLTVDTRRNRLLCRRWGELSSQGVDKKMEELDKSQAGLRTLPASFPVQITDAFYQRPVHSPLNLMYPQDYKFPGNEMTLDQWKRILDQVQGFSSDAVITLGLYHEPSAHSHFPEFLEIAQNYPGILLVVETSGLGWKSGVLERAREKSGAGVKWIVELDADDPSIYQTIRGPGLEEALGTVELLGRLYPDSVWVQCVRMKEWEETYEGFWRRWKEKLSGRVIIQKYSSFSGVLPDRKVSDLSPLKRGACWHLKRDVAIWLDGTVGLCFQDVKKQVKTGNIFEQDLSEIWNNGQKIYEEHLKDFSPGLCRGCDEYYTFHF